MIQNLLIYVQYILFSCNMSNVDKIDNEIMKSYLIIIVLVILDVIGMIFIFYFFLYLFKKILKKNK